MRKCVHKCVVIEYSSIGGTLGRGEENMDEEGCRYGIDEGRHV